MALTDLKQDEMMAHLLASLEAGKDIGHYGRLTFAMVARHFLPPDEVIAYLVKDPGCDETQARALLHQVESRGYNPPKRERVLEWDEKQEFPICPNPDDPDVCNIYRNLELPDGVYENIQQYHKQKVKAEE